MWSSGLQKAAHLFGLLSCRFVSSLNVLKTFGLLPLVSLCCLVASQDPRERMFPSSGACCSAGSSCHRALIPSSSVSPGLGSLQRALSRLASFPWHSRPRGTAQGRTELVLPGRCPVLVPHSTAGSFSPVREGKKSSAAGSGGDFLCPCCFVPDTLLVHTREFGWSLPCPPLCSRRGGIESLGNQLFDTRQC